MNGEFVKKTLLTLIALVSISANAASLRCEQSIDNVVVTTAKYVELRNSSNDTDVVGPAQDSMFKAIAEANSACK